MDIMTWLVDALRGHPELAVFLVLALGAAIGQIGRREFQIGPILGSLIAGLLVGNLGIPAPEGMKDVFFLLFLFAVGLRTGAEFFRGLRASALPQLILVFILCFTGLALAWGFTRLWSLDGGTSAGLFAGAMTNSTALGTATDATTGLALDAAARTRLAHNIATAYALTYIFGLGLVLWFLPNVGPWLMRVDLKAVSRELERSFGSTGAAPSVNSAYRPIAARGYRLPPEFDGLTVAEVEGRWAPDSRAIIARVRHGDAVLDAVPAMRLCAGDAIAIVGRSTALVGDGNPLEHHELHDDALLEIPTVSAELVLTSRALAGLPLRELVERIAARSIFLLA